MCKTVNNLRKKSKLEQADGLIQAEEEEEVCSSLIHHDYVQLIITHSKI
jgi:hypothetical protein